MSAKWRALQHRHQYTYSSVIFPRSFVDSLEEVPPETLGSAREFFDNLRSLISLSNTYSQIPAAKALCSSFSRLLAASDTPSATLSVAVPLFLEILFLENSLPLHRTLLSPLMQSKNSLSLIASCFACLCGDYGDANGKGKTRFLVARAVLSIMGFPKLGFLSETLEDCATSIAADISYGLTDVINDMECGCRPSPFVLEQCQEAMSCLYYLLQKFPSRFFAEGLEFSCLEGVIATISSVLKSTEFSRDCLVAAGVSYNAALQTCLSSEQLCLFIARGFFAFNDPNRETGSSFVMKALASRGLCSEFEDLPVLNRLCLLRGILTAIPRTVLNNGLVQPDSGILWTILYDGIFPELCNYCENPTDSHFNFHALTVMQICLQQMKTSILSDLTEFSGDYNPLAKGMQYRVLKIIWNNLEDPLSQTVKQVLLIFELLLDILSSISSVEGSKVDSFFRRISEDLLKLGPRCKGRYGPLAALTRRLGAKSILELNASLLYETMYAYIDDDVCSAATSFLKCFLECLRNELWSDEGIDKGYENFRELCLLPLMHGLVCDNSKLRSNLNTYALPAILDVDVDSVFAMLAFVSIGPTSESYKSSNELNVGQCVAALVSLLKVSRSLALIEGDFDLERSDSVANSNFATVCLKGVTIRIPVQWLFLALVHVDESVRIDASETLFLNPKTASLPSSLELSLMKEVLPLNMRCCSTAFQMKWASLFRKFFNRVKTALERQVKQGLWKPLTVFNGCSNGDEDVQDGDSKDALINKAEGLLQFMKWLNCFLFYSCYPSAPYERKSMAMDLILLMIDVWPTNISQEDDNIYPYNKDFTAPDSTLLFVGSIIDSWDKLRESAFRILQNFPTPLPGISSHDSLNEVILWAKELVCSPRVRESDAGALTLRLIFNKYVLNLRWQVGVPSNLVDPKCVEKTEKSPALQARTPVVAYLLSLVSWLRVVVEAGEMDLSKACKTSFVHGVLLALRYTFEELDWNSDVLLSCRNEMRSLLQEMLELIMRITSLALWVVSADALSIPYDIEDVADDGDPFSDLSAMADEYEPLEELQDETLKVDDAVRPTEQIVMVGCWLAMKEVSLLLGTIIRKIPLPNCSPPGFLSSDCSDVTSSDNQLGIDDYAILDLEQLEAIGHHFLEVLLKMKHNGAIDKTRAGFTALCNRLLCSNDIRLCKMTESWMEQLMERTTAKGQTVDDLLRRSAGIPAAFIAFFLSEPQGAPKRLLPRALRWLIDLANMSLHNVENEQKYAGEVLTRILSLDETEEEVPTKETVAQGNPSKIRDEGVIPTVHAFNVLRAAFNDTNLAADTSGFCAEALIIAIRSFSSPYWEVRNSACLAYTSLVRRMIGYLNVQKRESARRALTGIEFFHRYSPLHPFLFSELKIASEMLGVAHPEHAHSNIAEAIHPSLCPILILLSRLKPSHINSEANDAFNPYLFMPFIQKCATQSNLRVRVLASRAMTSLVSHEKLHTVICGVARNLLPRRHITSHSTALDTDQSVCSSQTHDSGDWSTYSTSLNSIHGTLLQLSSLLDGNCRDIIDNDKKDQILGEVIQVLMKCSWIGSTTTCSCPILNTSYLCVLDQMLGIARTCTTSRHLGTIQNLLVDLSLKCLVKEKKCGFTCYDPTNIQLRARAAASYFGCILGQNPEDNDDSMPNLFSRGSCKSKMPEIEISVNEFQLQVVTCVSDAAYEVRHATLKKLFCFVNCLKLEDGGGGDSGKHAWAKTHLVSTLMRCLVVEENPKCLYYVLKIIFSWNILQFKRSPTSSCGEIFDEFDSVSSFWARLMYLNGTVKRMKTREILLCCMGICVKKFSRILWASLLSNGRSNDENLFDSGSKERGLEVYKCIESFIILLKQHSGSSEPVSTRKAAAESIIASGLLEETTSVATLVSNAQISHQYQDSNALENTNSHLDMVGAIEGPAAEFYACRILDLWRICIQLLEDENAEIRQMLSKSIQILFNPDGPAKSVPSQVDRVIMLAFDFLSSAFGNWLEYLAYLLRWVSESAVSVDSSHGLVRRIFDKEIDNHHEEKLLVCQICCTHLEKLLSSKCCDLAARPQERLIKGRFEAFLKGWMLKFIGQLISFTSECRGGMDAAGWIGGLGNHKDAFTPIYVNMLGLLAVLRGLSDLYRSSELVFDAHKGYLSQFAVFGRDVGPFLGNPLNSNLYYLLRQTHEKVFGDLPNEACHSCSFWENFDPHFLLR